MSVLSSVALFLPVTVVGFLLGGFVASRLMKPTGMGFDRLADVLGGIMVGTVLGVVLAIVLIVKLGTRQRWVTAAIAIVALVLLRFLFELVPPSKAPMVAPPPAESSSAPAVPTVPADP